MRSLSTCLPVHHRWLLMPLLRALMAHHWCSGPRTRKSIHTGASRHVTRIMRIGGTRSRRIHLHLRIGWHSYKRTVRMLIRHHLPTHSRARMANKLATWSTVKANMLDVGAHAVLRHLHLLRKSRHWLWLRSIGIRRHSAR